MRIPSELHRESLYRQRGRRPSQDPSWRRLVRLLVVLGLVVVLMKQAGKPAVYQVFFPERMVPVETNVQAAVQASHQEGVSTQHVVAQIIESEADQDLTEDVTSEEVAEVSNAETTDLVRQWTQEQQIAWMRNWLNPGDSASSDHVPPAVNDPTGSATVAITIQKEWITQSKDGTVWRSDDQLGLYSSLAIHRLLMSGGSNENSDASSPKMLIELSRQLSQRSAIGVLPLLQQPDVYRGQPILAQGDLVRVERLTAPSNDMGIIVYWNLWLRPNDASERPWLVVVPDLPVALSSVEERMADEFPASKPSTETASFDLPSPYPTIAVHGEFLKRLSYLAASGPELTPVVVGHIAAIQSNGNSLVTLPQASTAPATGRAGNETMPLWVLLAGAIVFGITVASWLMWRSAKLSEQLRAKRNEREVTIE